MFYNKKIEEIELELKTSKDGLTEKEASTRLEKCGRNILPKKKSAGVVKIFFNQFKDPLLILLLVAILS